MAIVTVLTRVHLNGLLSVRRLAGMLIMWHWIGRSSDLAPPRTVLMAWFLWLVARIRWRDGCLQVCHRDFLKALLAVFWLDEILPAPPPPTPHITLARGVGFGTGWTQGAETPRCVGWCTCKKNTHWMNICWVTIYWNTKIRFQWKNKNILNVILKKLRSNLLKICKQTHSEQQSQSSLFKTKPLKSWVVAL